MIKLVVITIIKIIFITHAYTNFHVDEKKFGIFEIPIHLRESCILLDTSLISASLISESYFSALVYSTPL